MYLIAVGCGSALAVDNLQDVLDDQGVFLLGNRTAFSSTSARRPLMVSCHSMETYAGSYVGVFEICSCVVAYSLVFPRFVHFSFGSKLRPTAFNSDMTAQIVRVFLSSCNQSV